MMETIHFYTLPFFEEIARRLNADAKWQKSVKDLTLRVICTASDRQRSFLIHISRGHVATAAISPDEPADFKFEAKYETWAQLCKGEAEFEQLVLAGKIRVAGPMPRLMSLMGPLNHIVLTARGFPKEF